MPAYFLRYFYVVMMFLTSAMGFCTEVPTNIPEALTINLRSRINGGWVWSSTDGKFCRGIDVLPSPDPKARGKAKGEQPDLETCAAESWAEYEAGNIGSDVTKWYFDMFFKSPNENQIGNLSDGAGMDGLTPIIRFANKLFLSYSDVEIGIIKLKEQYRQDCKQILNAFLELFSLPEGRKLAWRTLVEIFRFVGRLEECAPSIDDTYIKFRNDGRSLLIDQAEKSSFIPTGLSSKSDLPLSVLLLSMQKNVIQQAVLESYSNKNGQKVFLISNGSEKPLSCSIGHELIHWFHSLRNPLRFSLDRSGQRTLGRINQENKSIIAWLHKGHLKGDSPKELERKLRTSILPWKVISNKTVTSSNGKTVTSTVKTQDLFSRSDYSQEEHLTICGAPSELITFYSHINEIDEEDKEDAFFYGDEISENRILVEYSKLFAGPHRNPLTLRCGHGDFDFLEDASIVNEISKMCGGQNFINNQTRQPRFNINKFSVSGLGQSFFEPNIH